MLQIIRLIVTYSDNADLGPFAGGWQREPAGLAETHSRLSPNHDVVNAVNAAIPHRGKPRRGDRTGFRHDHSPRVETAGQKLDIPLPGVVPEHNHVDGLPIDVRSKREPVRQGHQAWAAPFRDR